ncbi:MAG: hypothetical protein M3Y58_19130 [Chloroflexota bacterium]|nr:hypothetical protein [Chloroflexota bacterium]
MAQVTNNLTTLDYFERRLATAVGDWEQLPDMAAEWHEWDSDSRMDFLTDWPVTEERTARLLAMESSLAPDDDRAVRLRALRGLVARNRPILEELEARIHEQ